MGTSQQGSNELGRGKVNKSDKTRRCWIRKEEELLIVSLKELVAQGWRSDHGFRAGYLIKLEEAMKKGFPGTDLKGIPHINSKLSSWKKDHSSLMRMLSHSGVDFNLKGNHMIDCQDDRWDQIVKNDGYARLMRYKSYPFLEDWKEIFGKDRASGENAEVVMDIVNKLKSGDNLAGAGMGSDNHVSPKEICGKDRATGENAEDVMDMANDLNCGDYLAGAGMTGDNHVSPKEVFEKDAAEDSLCESEQSDRLQRQAEQKRKTVDKVQNVRELLAEIHRNTDARLMDMVNGLKHEDHLAGAGMAGDNHVSPKEASEKDAAEDSQCQSDQSDRLQAQAKKKRKEVGTMQGVCELLAEIHGNTNEQSDRLQRRAKKKRKAVDRVQGVCKLLAEIHRNTKEQSDRLQRQAKRKRKKVDRLQKVCELLAEIHRNTNARLDNLVNRIGYECDLGKARSEVFDDLGKIPGLTLDEKFDVCEILAAKDGCLQVFMGLPDSVRPQYVARLLKSKGV